MLQLARPLGRHDTAPDRIAALVLRLEDEISPSLTLTTLAVRSMGGGVQAMVIAHLSDGARERFSASDARVLAVALRDAAGHVSQLEAWADGLDEAADAADREAGASILGRGCGRNRPHSLAVAYPFSRGRA